MSIKIVTPKKSVNSAFLKLPVPVEKMELFKSSLVNLYNKWDLTKDEEYHKNKLQVFLKGIFNRLIRCMLIDLLTWRFLMEIREKLKTIHI